MEDAKVLEFINKHHEESYKDHVRKQIKKKKFYIIQDILLVLAILTIVYVLGNIIYQESQNAVKSCVKLGHTYNYCLKDSQ